MQSTTITRRRPGPIRLGEIRSRSASTWARMGFLLLCVGALAGYLAFPTYPTYDSFYALLWGRDLLHLHLPDFEVYRAPTEHPLAIAFGLICSLFGQGGARLIILGSIGSFVACVSGVYRLASVTYQPFIGLLAALLMLSRFFDENLAAQGYLDISYIALVVWATALEVARPRRGTSVFLLLAAAGLLRPDAWLLSGAYWLWCCWPGHASNRRRAVYLALTLIGPAVWMALDGIVTGNPLHSLQATSELAQELGRSKGLGGALSSLVSYAVRIDKLALVAGGVIGAAISVWLAPRRTAIPLAALVLQLLFFLAEGAAGVSVIDRYMLGAAAFLLIFCAVFLGGWTMLAPSLLRRVWMLCAAALIVYGAIAAATTLSLGNLQTTLAYQEEYHRALARALDSAPVQRELARCPMVSVPDNKLIPNARWILGRYGQGDIVARSQARALAERGRPALEDRLRHGSVAIYPLGEAIFHEAIVDEGDSPKDIIPGPGFHRIYTSRYYAVYGNC